MIALSCVLYVGTTMIPAVGEGLNYISAIPIVYVGVTIGVNMSVLSVLMGSLLVFLLTGNPLWSLEYVFFIGILSISIGYGFKKQWSGNTTIVSAIIFTFVGLLVFTLIAFIFLGKNNPFFSPGTAKMDRIFNYFVWAMMFLTSILSTILVYLASVIILMRFSIKVPPIILGQRSILQKSLFFPYILSLTLLLILLFKGKDPILFRLIANAFIILSSIYTLYGYKMIFEKMLIRRDKKKEFILLMLFPPIEFGYAIFYGFLDAIRK